MQSLRKEVELYDREGKIKNEIATIVLRAGATLGLGTSDVSLAACRRPLQRERGIGAKTDAAVV
jgi:hypothetical protein